jgi:hypothetical protein
MADYVLLVSTSFGVFGVVWEEPELGFLLCLDMHAKRLEVKGGECGNEVVVHTIYRVTTIWNELIDKWLGNERGGIWRSAAQAQAPNEDIALVHTYSF